MLKIMAGYGGTLGKVWFAKIREFQQSTLDSPEQECPNGRLWRNIGKSMVCQNQRVLAKCSQFTRIGTLAQAKVLKPKHSKIMSHHYVTSQNLLTIVGHHGEITFLNHHDETINSTIQSLCLETSRTWNFTMLSIANAK